MAVKKTKNTKQSKNSKQQSKRSKPVKKSAAKITRKNTKTAVKSTTKSNAKLVLIVDDEADIRSSVKTILEKNGYKTLTANNGDECLSVLATKKPDMILLDIMMPGTPVREVVEKIKDVPVAFLSVVRTSEQEKQELLKQTNIKAFIQKPFDLQNLLGEVKKIVG